MGYKKGSKLQNKDKSIVNDSFILTIMCLIGLSVDVYIKDGSLYSGILFTASVDQHYAIVLKRARKIKKGSYDSNVVNEEVIGTLIIKSEDLVQVVAKRELIPTNGVAGNENGDVTGAVAGTPLLETNESTMKSNIDQPHTNQTRCSSGTENGFANGIKHEISNSSTNNLEINKNANIQVVQVKTSKVNEHEPFVSSSSSPSENVTSNVSNSNRNAKEFKLNPGAKIYSPSFPNKRSPTPSVIPSSPNIPYIHDSYPTVPIASHQPEIEISPYVPRSMPVKFVPYGGNDVQHPPPIVGYMANRSQPVRYGGQYHHPVQTAPTYVQSNSQNVMLGRLGPVVYVHPVSQDMVPNTNAFPQMSTRSILTPLQVHVPKHQGTVMGQAFPPFIGGGQQPFVLQNHIPISQPSYPLIRPMLIPGSNGYLVSKFS